MVTDFKRNIAYICPQCGQTAFTMLRPFNLSGKRTISVLCPNDNCGFICGGILNQKNTYYFETLCPICGGVHGIKVPKASVWNNPIISLTCDASGIGYFFIGTAKDIKKALKKAKDDCREFNAEPDCYFDDFQTPDGDEELSSLIVSIVDYFCLLKDNNALVCRCGSHNISVTVIDNKIGLRCADCRSIRHIEPSREYLDRLCRSEVFEFNK